ncbi:hypothetical protein CPB85DRAFT_1373962 [Mucidula mucida]|nr:hypothetical protein CPB85DRAFT_1373962 [Mucidula mucida]
MATDALRSQVAAKWQDAFARLNRDEPGISGLMSFSQAWSLATEFLRPKDLSDPVQTYNLDLIRHAFDVVSQCRRLPVMLESFLDNIRQHFGLIHLDIDAFMVEYEVRDVQLLLVQRLMEWYTLWQPITELGLTIRSAYTLNFQTHLFAILSPTFVKGFKDLCAATLPPLDGDAPPAIALPEEYVIANCTEKWDVAVLPGLKTWMSGKIVPWMLMMYAKDATTTNNRSEEDVLAVMASVGSRFDFHMTKTLCDLRTRDLFDIIINFPESTPALEDLKECLQRVDQRSSLVRSLRKANRRRLLHPGADTTLILTQYVATIKCLRIVDPPGVLLYKVADPIRRYLRERPDTIRCIVSNLVGDDESGDSIIDDNEPPQPLHQVEIEDYSDPNWDPEPLDAGPDFRANKPSDIISTLVSIYDSKDLFVKELQVLLAQRLLAITDGSTEKRRNIEILKIRFGDAALQVCEVMLKDMTDSKRIDTHVQSQNESVQVMHPTIISRQFWPMLETNELNMPGQFKTFQDAYAKEFSTFKPDKKLRWLPHLGTVQLHLELQDRTVEVEVPPLEAAFIELFLKRGLMERVGKVSKSAALKALLTWVDHGVLKEDKVAEVAVQRERTRLAVAEQEASTTPEQQQQSQQLMVYWKYIQGMLTNLPNMTVERIHSMLNFVEGYNLTVGQLHSLMDSARREKLVDVKEGLWRLLPQQ